VTPERAEILALQALGWLAGDEAGLERFLNLSGTGMEALKAGAGSRETGLAVLDFLLAQEDLIQRFCAETDTPPQLIHAAHRLLDGAGG
jgi:hypothetical protein